MSGSLLMESFHRELVTLPEARFEIEPDGYCYACLACPVAVVRDFRFSTVYCIRCTRFYRPSLGL